MDRPDGARELTAPGARVRVRAAAGSLVAVLRNRAIRNLELGWTIGTAADWALLVVALLVAYDAGGPVLVGFVSLVRMIPATLVNVLVDPARFGRPERGLVAVNLVRSAGAAVTTLAIVVDAPLAVFAAVAVAAAANALVRPTTMALLPAVARTPEELVSANVTNSLGEAFGTFVGPLIAGLTVAASGPAPAAALAAAASLAAASLVTRVRVADAARPRHTDAPRTIPLVDGLRELARRTPAAVMMASFLAQVTVRGALTTYMAILAIEVLGLGESGVGLLGAAIGLGGLAGSVASLTLGSSRGLAAVAMLALAGWGLPLMVIGLVATPSVALAALAIVGVANAVLDVAGFTLLQRGIPNRSRAAVFSVLEVAVGLGISIGGLLGSLLVARLGVELALVATGAVLPVAAALTLPFARRLDTEAVVPRHHEALLRSVPLFCPLPLAGLELLAGGMREVRYEAGDTLMAEGEPGDRYLVIERGRVAVSSGGEHLRDQGAGDGIGEIALLRTLPRTATVVATEPVEAWAIDGPTFLAAVTGHDVSAAEAEALVAARIGDGPRPA
jgi:predicted MFS family arabinose efflux permease